MTEVTVKSIQKAFDDFLYQEDWSAMGWMFWDLFALYENGTPERILASKLWDSLTKEQKDYCEGV